MSVRRRVRWALVAAVPLYFVAGAGTLVIVALGMLAPPFWFALLGWLPLVAVGWFAWARWYHRTTAAAEPVTATVDGT